jgi:general secretion pathway protein D
LFAKGFAMKLHFRPAAILLILLAIISPVPAADKSKNLYKLGREAEARQNYEQAYDLYKQAFDLKPGNLTYRASFERLRFLAGASHVHKGQLLRDAGQLDAALAEFRKAAEVDPSSAIAKQELQRTQQMIDEAKAAPSKVSGPPPNYLQKLIQHAAGPVELAPISNVPINLKITEDSKVIYETVGKLAGINVLFDPDYTSRRIKIELNNVSLEEALQIIAVETKTFWRPVTPNTVFVAADNPAKRKDLEQVAVKTFYLSNLSQPTELQDVTNAMRQILEINRIQPLPSESAIVVRGTPDQLALAQWLIGDLDRSKSEVVIDVAIMQINRDKSRTLGINPPTSGTVQLQQNVNTTTTTATTNSGAGGTVTQSNGNGSINLNTLGNLNATDFTVTISQATATALFSDSDTRLIQKPQIRAIDGQKASLKIGQRVPVATGSFQPGIGGVGINPLVNTQFQYLDVGVNIDVTPRVHANGDVTMKITMEVSEVDSTSNIGGINQPVIGQRKIEHEVRLKEGEVNLLGGMMEDQQTRALTGFPLLSQIPILKYLFGQTTTGHSETETVFVLIPHIVRKQEMTALDQAALDIGTASAISLRQVSHPIDAVPSAAPSAPAQSPAAQPQGQNPQAIAPIPQAAQSPTPQPIAASFGFDPPTITQPKGATFTVNVLLSGAQNAYSVPLQVSYDPKMLQVVNVSNGTLLSQDGQPVALVHRDDDTTGTLQVTATRPPGASGISGAGPVVTLTFMAKAPGQSSIAISKGGMRDPGMQPTLVGGATANVTIQ